jgi:hypothetical protein
MLALPPFNVDHMGGPGGMDGMPLPDPQHKPVGLDPS